MNLKNMLSERSQKQEYMLCDPINMKLKNKQN